ncbi:MAG: VCBS repeat-containing protein [Nitrospira sp.]
MVTDPEDNNSVIYTAREDAQFGQTARLEARSVENPEVFETATIILTTLEETPKTLDQSVDEIVVGGLPVSPSNTIDFNGDEIIDMVSRNSADGSVIFNLGNFPGPNQPPSFTRKDAPPVSNPVSLVVGDFVNFLGLREFLADIAVLSQNTNGPGGEVIFISGMKETTQANFTPEINTEILTIPTVSGVPQFLVSGRFHDPPEAGLFTPVSDLAIGTDTGKVIIFLQDRNPPGTHSPVFFSPPQTVSINGVPKQLLPGDFNGNGRKEIAVVLEGGRDLVILKANEQGFFSIQRISMLFSAPVEALISADINGDGIGDLVAAHTPPTNKLSVFLGDGTGNFTPASVMSTTFPPGKMAVGEYNLEGNIDVAVTNAQDNKIHLFFGDGSGQFVGEWQSKSISSPPLSLISGSFSGFPTITGFQNADLMYIQTSTLTTKLHIINNKNSQ